MAGRQDSKWLQTILLFRLGTRTADFFWAEAINTVVGIEASHLANIGTFPWISSDSNMFTTKHHNKTNRFTSIRASKPHVRYRSPIPGVPHMFHPAGWGNKNMFRPKRHINNFMWNWWYSSWRSFGFDPNTASWDELRLNSYPTHWQKFPTTSQFCVYFYVYILSNCVTKSIHNIKNNCVRCISYIYIYS